jgi:hypothetical protein
MASMVPAHAAASGTEGAAFLDIPVGAGPAALGSAYSALASDAYAPVLNPAGLGFLSSTQIAGQHLSYLESIHDEFLSFVSPLGHGRGLGVSAQYLGSGDIAGTDLDGNTLPSYSTHFAAYSVAYGQTIGDKLSLGITGKWINAKISDVSSNAFAADIGSLYKVGDHLSLAATVTNMGNKLTFLNDNSSLPLAGHLGLAYEPTHRLLISLEGVYPKTGVTSGHIGVQWKPLSAVALRAGYRTDTTKELGAMAGPTIGAAVEAWGQELSYAWLPMGDLGNTQYFSLIVRFGQTQEAKENLIRGQDIKRHRSVGKDKDKEDVESQQLMELLKSGEEHTAQKTNSKPEDQAR